MQFQLKVGIIAVVIIGLIIAAIQFDIGGLLKEVLDWIKNLGSWGAIAFILLYIGATVLFVPGSLLTLGAGFIFGVVLGSIYVSIGATIGATAAFLIGRYFARDWVAKQIESRPKFRAIDSAVAKEGWKIVALLRLSPLFPFNLLNYGLGITKVSLRDYFFASWIGMLPGTVMYIYIGSIAENVATLGTKNEQASSIQWIIRIVGFIATVAVTLYVTKIAQKALDSQIDTHSEAIAQRETISE